MFIPTDILKAAHLFIGKEQTRYYLQGVNIEAADPGVRLTSTDGHRLFTAGVAFEDPHPAFEAFILPGDAIKRALTGYKELMIEIDEIKETVGGVSFKAIDGTFPDWRRVAPSKFTGEAAQFNSDYVHDFGKAAKILNGGKKSFNGLGAYIAHNGQSPAVVTFGRDDCMGLLMPMRSAVGESNEKALDLLTAHFGREPEIEKKVAA